MNKLLLTSEESFKRWFSTYAGKGCHCGADRDPPEQYPCVITWWEYDINNSMSYGWGIDYAYVYLADFEE